MIDEKISDLITKASDVKIRPVKWIWDPFIVDNNVNLLGGTGGTGKTYFISALAAAITTGVQPDGMPGTLRSMGNVLYLGSEDGNEEMARRLKELGADMTKVVLIEKIIPVTDKRLEAVISAIKPELVVFDALISYFPHGYNPNAQQDVRFVMDNLRDLARSYDTSILTVVHPGKNTEYKLENRFGGSKAFVDSVRNAIYLGPHPTIAGMRVGLQVKTNIKKGIPFQFDIDKELGFEWQGEADGITPRDIEKVEEAIERKDSKLIEYERVIINVLKLHPKGIEMTAAEILKEYEKIIPHRIGIKSFGHALNKQVLKNNLLAKGIKLEKGSNTHNKQKYNIYDTSLLKPL